MGTAQALTVRAQVRPVGGSELDRFLDQVIVSRLRAGVSSSAVPDPRAGAWAAVDGDRGTGWVAGADEPTPELTLTWRSPRVITAVRLHQDDSLAASVPTVVTLEADDGAHRYEVPPRGRVALDEPLRTDSLTIGFDQVRRVYTYAAATGATEELPVGVSEVWLAGGPGARVDLKSAEPVQVPCGGGPRLVVDGTELETAMSTSVRGLAGLEPTAVSVCADRSQQFAAGQHRLELDSGPLWRAEWALLSSEPQAVDASNRIDVNVDEWGDAERSVDVPYRDEPTLLSVTENANPGWRASLDGELLEPVTIDGWKQGYLVPAGDAGTVQLTFAPAGTYRLALIGGLALFLLLGLLTLANTRRPARHGPAVPLRLPWPVATALVLSGLALLGGAWGLLAGIAVCAVGFMLRRVRRQTLRTWCSALAGTCYAVAGGLTLLSDGQGAMLSAVLALSALAVVLLSPRADPAASG
jgi:arabinofuranan 3-O-arabinosyltransferase